MHDALDRPFFFLDDSGFCPWEGLPQCEEKWQPAPGNVQGEISVFNPHSGACALQGMSGCVRINSGQDKGLVRGCNVTQQRRPELLSVKCNQAKSVWCGCLSMHIQRAFVSDPELS